MWGVAAATLAGLLTSHFVLRLIHDDENGASIGAFIVNHVMEPLRTDSNSCTQAGVVVALLGSIAAIGFGITVPAFQFSYKGATESLEQLAGEPVSTTYTVVSLIQKMSSSGHGNTAAEVALAQASVVLFAVVMPLAHLGVTLAVWLAPIRSNWLPFVTTLEHVLLSWAALDVFIFSIVVGFLQVSLFAGFIVGQKCDALAPVLSAPKVAPLLDGDPKCLDVSATLLWGTWLLAAAALISQAAVRWPRHHFGLRFIILVCVSLLAPGRTAAGLLPSWRVVLRCVDRQFALIVHFPTVLCPKWLQCFRASTCCIGSGSGPTRRGATTTLSTNTSVHPFSAVIQHLNTAHNRVWHPLLRGRVGLRLR